MEWEMENSSVGKSYLPKCELSVFSEIVYNIPECSQTSPPASVTDTGSGWRERKNYNT